MKIRFFQVGIQEILLELIEYLLNRIDIMYFIDVDQDIILVDNHKNI